MNQEKVSDNEGVGKSSGPLDSGGCGLPWPCWRVRVVMKGGGLLHFLSRTEPRVISLRGDIEDVVADFVEGSAHGDTLGFIDWREVGAVAWRAVPLEETRDACAKRTPVRAPLPVAVALLSVVEANPGLTEQNYREKWSSVSGKNGFWPVRKGLHDAVEKGWLTTRSADGATRYRVTEAGRKALAECDADSDRLSEFGSPASGARKEA